MSTDGWARQRSSTSRLAGLVSGVLVCLSGLSPVSAAQTVFTPTAKLSVSRDGNPAKVGTAAETDWTATLFLDLQLTVNTANSTWLLAYEPSREVYRDSSALDNTAHVFTTKLNTQVSTRSTVGIRLLAARTERQTITVDRPGDPTTLLPRTTLSGVSLDLEGRFDTSGRRFWTWEVGGGIARYDDRPSISYQDSDTYQATVGYGLQGSRRTSNTVRYGYQNLSFETLDAVSVHNLDWVLDHEFGRVVTGRFGLGVFRALRGGEELATEPRIELAIGGRYPRSTVQGGIQQSASAGTGLSGATRDRGGFLSWGRTLSRNLGIRLHARLWERTPLDPGISGGALETLRTREALTWATGRFVTLEVFHEFQDQSGRGAQPIGSLDPSGTSYHSGGFNVTWYIRGRR